MSQYAVIKNKEIIELYDSVPRNWKNVSGFNLMTDEERKAFGFVQVIQNNAVDYDPQFHNLTAEHIFDDNGNVVYKETITAKYTDDEILEWKKNDVLNRVREYRSNLLSQTDWAVMPDVIAVKGEDWKNAYYEYRQSLRDITNDLPNTYEEVIWPTLGL